MKKPKAPKLVTVSIFTTATIILWVFVSLYFVLTGDPKVEVDPKLLEPIDPKLDIETLQKLPSKIYFENDTAPNRANIIQETTSEEVIEIDEGLIIPQEEVVANEEGG